VHHLPKKSHQDVLAYMTAMEDDAKEMKEKTLEEYSPIEQNCTLHRIAFLRVDNHTARMLAAIKSQAAYQNETAELKAAMDSYTAKVSAWKQVYANMTLRQPEIQKEIDNTTLTCYGHLELHNRLIATLKELKTATDSSGSTALLEESMDDTLKLRIASLVGENPSAETMAKAYGTLLNSIRKEKSLKGVECEEKMKVLDEELKEVISTHTSLHQKITEHNSYVKSVLQPKLEAVLVNMKRDNKRASALLKLRAQRDHEFKIHETECKRKEREHNDELVNLHAMENAITLIRGALGTKKNQITVGMAEKKLKAEADKAILAGADKKDQDFFDYMPRLRKHLKRLDKDGTYRGTSEEIVEGGRKPEAADKHGCNRSAGFSYCTFSKRCQRMWEEPCTYQAEVDSDRAAKNVGKMPERQRSVTNPEMQ